MKVAIAVVADLKKDDQTRLNCLAHPSRAKGEYTVACSINGGPRKHPGEELHAIIDKLIDDLESVVYDLWLLPKLLNPLKLGRIGETIYRLVSYIREIRD